MKKEIIIKAGIWGMTFLMLWVSSCNDFLKEDPKGRLASMYFFKNPTDLDAAINALYAVVAGAMIGNHLTGTRCLSGDDITTHRFASKIALRQHDQYCVTNSDSWTSYNWEALYQIVKAANFIINNAEKTPAPEEDIRYTLAQAHYWRGYAYF